MYEITRQMVGFVAALVLSSNIIFDKVKLTRAIRSQLEKKNKLLVYYINAAPGDRQWDTGDMRPEYYPYYYYTNDMGKSFGTLRQEHRERIHGMMLGNTDLDESVLSSIMGQYCTSCAVAEGIGYHFV